MKFLIVVSLLCTSIFAMGFSCANKEAPKVENTKVEKQEKYDETILSDEGMENLKEIYPSWLIPILIGVGSWFVSQTAPTQEELARPRSEEEMKLLDEILEEMKR